MSAWKALFFFGGKPAVLLFVNRIRVAGVSAENIKHVPAAGKRKMDRNDAFEILNAQRAFNSIIEKVSNYGAEIHFTNGQFR